MTYGISDEFMHAIEANENILEEMQFLKRNVIEKGYAFFVTFEKKGETIEFLFGPPEFQIELLIKTCKGKFAFKDLLRVSLIKTWVENNRYKQGSGRDIEKELIWYIELIKYSLPLIS